jgi:hypothetical protein
MHMQRREFSQALAALGLQRAALAAGQGAKTAPVVMGTNLSGMEWTKPCLRYGLSSAPNLYFNVPRRADVAYLASCGFTQNRLPIQWEPPRPMLHDTQANATARALIGEPGRFHADVCNLTGHIDAFITEKSALTAAKPAVLERYLGAICCHLGRG